MTINKKDNEQKNISELKQQLSSVRKQLIEARIKQSSGKIKDTSTLKKLKYQISLILTLITQKQNDTHHQNKN